ncbi:MAG: ABC transporter permease [Lachnospiraceae bacterium]|nr:ABC transporter permease [Lachnospiraceae bacterium]
MYLAFFKIKFLTGLQYRAAAAAGMVTQFVWGIMELLLYKAFYETDAGAFPMDFQALTSYIWLQQAFLTLVFVWVFEEDIFQTITGGGVVYELCRPVDLYGMWYARSIANRLSMAVLRCIPVLVFAALLKKPYGMGLPAGVGAAFWFLASFVLALFNVVAFTMLIYVSAFYTIQTAGIKILAAGLVEFLSGATIPLPFLPDGVRHAVELLPFASMQNIPFRVYGGDLAGEEMYLKILLQLFWLVIMVGAGRLLTKKAMRRIVVQGG